MKRYVVKPILLLIATFCLSIGSNNLTAADKVALPKQENFHLYLLIGQSNMAGRGLMTDEDKQPVSGILMLNKENEWEPAHHPLHFDKPSIVGVGLGLTFAKKMKGDNKKITIGLIPCAVGGTPLSRWVRGKGLYEAALQRAKLAMQVGELKGILWHQGEAETKSEELTGSYQQRLTGAIATWREDLNQPRVPFVAGELGRFFLKHPMRGENAKKVNQQLHQLIKQVNRYGVATSEGLQSKEDKVHFNAASYKEFGMRYANVMKRLQADKR